MTEAVVAENQLVEKLRKLSSRIKFPVWMAGLLGKADQFTVRIDSPIWVDHVQMHTIGYYENVNDVFPVWEKIWPDEKIIEDIRSDSLIMTEAEKDKYVAFRGDNKRHILWGLIKF